MAVSAPDNEKAIALAFLRTGHPWLAFAIVIIKSVSRAAVVLTLVTAGFAIGESGVMSDLLNAIPSLL